MSLPDKTSGGVRPQYIEDLQSIARELRSIMEEKPPISAERIYSVISFIGRIRCTSDDERVLLEHVVDLLRETYGSFGDRRRRMIEEKLTASIASIQSTILTHENRVELKRFLNGSTDGFKTSTSYVKIDDFLTPSSKKASVEDRPNAEVMSEYSILTPAPDDPIITIRPTYFGITVDVIALIRFISKKIKRYPS